MILLTFHPITLAKRKDILEIMSAKKESFHQVNIILAFGFLGTDLL